MYLRAPRILFFLLTTALCISEIGLASWSIARAHDLQHRVSHTLPGASLDVDDAISVGAAVSAASATAALLCLAMLGLTLFRPRQVETLKTVRIKEGIFGFILIFFLATLIPATVSTFIASLSLLSRRHTQELNRYACLSAACLIHYSTLCCMVLAMLSIVLYGQQVWSDSSSRNPRHRNSRSCEGKRAKPGLLRSEADPFLRHRRLDRLAIDPRFPHPRLYRRSQNPQARPGRQRHCRCTSLGGLFSRRGGQAVDGDYQSREADDGT